MAKSHSTKRKGARNRVDYDNLNEVQLALLRAGDTWLATQLAERGMMQPLWLLDEVEVALLRANRRPLAEAFGKFRQQLGQGPDNEYAVCDRETVWRELSEIARRLRIRLKPIERVRP